MKHLTLLGAAVWMSLLAGCQQNELTGKINFVDNHFESGILNTTNEIDLPQTSIHILQKVIGLSRYFM